MTTTAGFAVALALFVIGFAGALSGRNVVKTIIGIELMSKGVLVNFITAGASGGQAIVVLLILVDAIVVAVMMGMTVAVYRHTGSLDVETLRGLTW